MEVEHSALAGFDEIADDQWVDFAKHYLSVMKDQFSPQFLAARAEDTRVKLYFEPRMSHDWQTAVEARFSPTPLLGVSPDPGDRQVTREQVSQMLAPLKKHLLLAHSVYFRDSFYYCFDAVADSVDRGDWDDNPNTRNLVQDSIRKLRGWLPILVELRELIESEALVFMPYYLTPSFPFFQPDTPALREANDRIRLRPGALPERPREPPGRVDFDGWADPPDLDPSQRSGYEPSFRHNDVIAAWLNSRLLGLDAVLPDRAMFDFASHLYFAEDGPDEADVLSDPISLEILPFGLAEEISLDDLVFLRRNEEAFECVRGAVSECKEVLEADVKPDASQKVVTAACRDVLGETLAQLERRSVLRFIEDRPVAGIGFSLAVGAATIPVAPAIGLAAGALLTPQLALLARRRFDPKRRAIGRLQALL